jgi:hypothetical protein
MISGQVNSLSNGRRKAFANPKINASQMMDNKLSRWIPGTNLMARKMAMALMIQRSMNLVIVFFPFFDSIRKTG